VGEIVTVRSVHIFKPVFPRIVMNAVRTLILKKNVLFHPETWMFFCAVLTKRKTSGLVTEAPALILKIQE
jgi:hypothetical protein